MPSDPPHAVFLSYSRDDTKAARGIADALRAFGLEVWFDQNELRGGDVWDQKIRRQIKECALFLPIISASTQARGEGYFRREWKLAVERTNDMAAGLAFIVPVVVDETAEDEAAVPEEFLRYQWTRLPPEVPLSQFAEQVRRLLETPRRPSMEAGSLRPARRDENASSPGTGQSGRRLLPIVAVGLVVLAVATSIYLLRNPAPAPPPASSNVMSVATPASAKSIAVLPFANMSEDRDGNAFFSDGIHEDILTNLALIRELHVVSRTSVLQYRVTTKPIRQIARELGVAYILEGSVRRAGHTVRVTGQLIDARTDEHVWAKSYDRDLSDVFAIQSELAQAIATALQAALSPQEKTLIGRRPTDNPAAYDLYLKARQQWQSGAQALTATEPLLREAVQLDPKFAAAWADLAARQAFAYFNDQDHTAGRLAGAKQAIDEAVRLAPDDPEVIEGLGDYYYYAYRDYPRATEQYLRLAQLRPNDPVMYFSLALIYRRQGRWADALPNFRRAVELDPTNLNYGIQFIQLLTALRHYDEAEDLARHWVQAIPQEIEPAWYLSSVRFFARGSTAGLDEFTRQSFAPPQAGRLDFFRKSNACLRGDFGEAIRLDRQHPYFDGFGEPHWSQDVGAAFVLAVHGDTAEARARAEQAIPSMKAELEKQPASAGLWLGLSGAYTLLGDKAQALRAGQKAMELVPESADAVAGPIYSLNLASSLAYLGEKDRALAELARLLRTPYGENIYVAKYSPAWYPLHGDRRFEALVNDPANNAPLF